MGINMKIKEYENLIKILESERSKLDDDNSSYYDELTNQIEELKEKCYKNLDAWDRVYMARHKDRPKAQEYINSLFSGFIELHGDRYFMDDASLISGIGLFHDIPVTIIAQTKGKSTQDNIKRNFGMNNPEGFRKALRVAKQAEKFKRPIITIVDTPGAFPGIGAEERGQAQAIATCLSEFSNLNTIVICIVISEGGSGGALALSIGDRIIMLENAVYSILSPEGFASILWKDEKLADKAANVMKLTAKDQFDRGIVDKIIKEPESGAQTCFEYIIKQLDQYLVNELNILSNKSMKLLLQERYDKYRKVGI